MSQRRSRLQRKARRVVVGESETQAEQQLGKARADRDKALFEANETFRKIVKQLQTERAEARKTAHAVYEEKRTAILKDVAAEEQAA